MKTKLNKKQKLILTVFSVLICALKIVAVHHVFVFLYPPESIPFSIPFVSILYYILMLALMWYLGYIKKGLIAINIIFTIQILIVLSTVLLSEFLRGSAVITLLWALSLLIIGPHGNLIDTIDIKSPFEYTEFAIIIIIYILFSAVGLISYKLNKGRSK